MAEEQAIAALDSLTTEGPHPDTVEVTSTVPKIDPLAVADPVDLTDPIIAAARAVSPEAKPDDKVVDEAPSKPANRIPLTRVELAKRNLNRATQALAEAEREHANACRQENEPAEPRPTLSQASRTA